MITNIFCSTTIHSLVKQRLRGNKNNVQCCSSLNKPHFDHCHAFQICSDSVSNICILFLKINYLQYVFSNFFIMYLADTLLLLWKFNCLTKRLSLDTNKIRKCRNCFSHDILRALHILLTVRLSGYV